METYRSAFTKDKLMSGDTAVVTGSYQNIGEFKVEAGQMIQLGFGANDTQEGANGRIYVDLKDNAAAPGANVDGTIRFSVHSPQGRPLRVLGEYRTETLRTDKSNRTLQIPFASNGMPFVSEDKKLVVEFLPDGNTTIGKANSFIIFDVTEAVV
jgi:hypothetical protein